MSGIRCAVLAIVGMWCASSPGDVTIRGRVTDKEGKPVADARVFCLKPARLNTPIESVDGKTNAEGLFELSVAVDHATDVKEEAVLIYAEGHGLGVTTAGVLLEAPAGAAPVAVSLPAETEKTFRVLDPAGRPVAGRSSIR